MLLHQDYARLQDLFRTPQDAQGYFAYIIVAHLLLCIGITWVYRQGRDARPRLGQGVRFGLALFVLMTLPTYLIYFAIQPMPSDIVAKQVVLDGIAIADPRHHGGRDESRSARRVAAADPWPRRTPLG